MYSLWIGGTVRVAAHPDGPFTKVERFTVEARLEAFHHNVDNPAAPDTIRVYQTHSGRACLWTRDDESRFTTSKLPTNA